MKESQVWIEEVSFVECPECNKTIELGRGMIFSSEGKANCACSCGCMFRLLEST